MKERHIVANILTILTLAACNAGPARPTEPTQRSVTIFSCYDGYYGGEPDDSCDGLNDLSIQVEFSVKNLAGDVLDEGETSPSGIGITEIPPTGQYLLVYPKVITQINKNGEVEFTCTLNQEAHPIPDGSGRIMIDLPFNPSFCNPVNPQEENALFSLSATLFSS
ncbi:hypothetical protein A3D78_02605 [Candidatus Gottesmanbacteria bacterium RIFCSPHIGHO2_02_FULL_39_14]|uniref:Lipoprotein n=1 Tax=Candidatus Gottesmanbacteria bacterium RIFCSPHIGHO2_02_FULL_39_14 TaxID=1798383 RepID=A0A1F5ZXZ8_9BACT|nr:MAG: hypothetical protein A3D78_02605 [Candidatus Gottesmanbacteria bacterium RIFCSPHIGHO2_02_FULL_39_14]